MSTTQSIVGVSVVGVIVDSSLAAKHPDAVGRDALFAPFWVLTPISDCASCLIRYTPHATGRSDNRQGDALYLSPAIYPLFVVLVMGRTGTRRRFRRRSSPNHIARRAAGDAHSMEQGQTPAQAMQEAYETQAHRVAQEQRPPHWTRSPRRLPICLRDLSAVAAAPKHATGSQETTLTI